MKLKIVLLLSFLCILTYCDINVNASTALYSLDSSSYNINDNVGSLIVTVNRSSNLLANPSFETGDFSGWTPGGVVGGCSVVTSTYTEGTHSAHMATGEGFYYQELNASAGETWRVKFDFKGASNPGGNGGVIVRFLNSTGSILYDARTCGLGTVVNWATYDYTMTAPAGTAIIGIYLYHTALDDFYIDNLYVIAPFNGGTVNYATNNGTALSGYDYTATSGTIDFSGGETSKSFSVPIIDRGAYYGDRAFNITLSNPVNGTLGISNTIVTIFDTHNSNINSPSGYTYLYVSNYDSSTVSVLDIATLQKVTDIKTRPNPYKTIVNAAGTILYVSYGTSTLVDAFSTVDFSLLHSIDVHAHVDSATEFTINDAGTRLYFVSGSDQKLYLVDLTNYNILNSVALSQSSTQYAIEYFNGYVYLSDNTNNKVMKYDSNTLSLIKTWSSPQVSRPGYMAIDKINNLLYVNNGYNDWNNDTTSVIDLSTNNIIRYLVGTDGAPVDIDVNISGYVYRSDCPTNDNIEVFNPSGTIIKSIGPNAYSAVNVLCNPYNMTLYATGQQANQGIRVISTVTNSVIITLSNPSYIAYLSIGTQATPAVQLTQLKLTTLGYIGLDGVPAAIYYNGNLLYSGETDGNGVFACYLNPTSTYTIKFNSPANGVDASYTITPVNSYYQFDQPFLDVLGGQFNNLVGPIITPDSFGNQSQVYYTQDAQIDQASGTGYINGTYIDYSGATSWLSFNLYGNNSTFGGAPTLIETQAAGSSGNYNFTIVNAAGNSYYIEIDASQSTGDVKKYYPQGVNFPGAVVLASTGIRLDWLFYIGIAIPMFIWGAGVVTRRGYMGLVGTVAAGIIGGWCHWYAVYIPDLLMWSAWTACFLLSLGVIIVDAEKWGR